MNNFQYLKILVCVFFSFYRWFVKRLAFFYSLSKEYVPPIDFNTVFVNIKEGNLLRILLKFSAKIYETNNMWNWISLILNLDLMIEQPIEYSYVGQTSLLGFVTIRHKQTKRPSFSFHFWINSAYLYHLKKCKDWWHKLIVFSNWIERDECIEFNGFIIQTGPL